MAEFSDSWLDRIGEIDGFVIKSRSPGGGPRPAKFFKDTRKGATISPKLPGSGTGGKTV